MDKSRCGILILILIFSMLLVVPCYATTDDVEPGERVISSGTTYADGDALVVIKAGTLYVESIMWEVPTTVGHDLELVTGYDDGSTEENLITMKCTVANQNSVYYPKTVIRGGLWVDQLDSGSLVVTYRNRRGFWRGDMMGLNPYSWITLSIAGAFLAGFYGRKRRNM